VRRSKWLWSLLVLMPLMLGMGGGPSGPVKIPEGTHNFSGVVTDITGQRVKLTHLTLEGQEFVIAKVGKGQLAVPFSRLKTMELASSGGKLRAKLRLSDGRELEVELTPSQKITGRSAYGNYSITLGQVRSLEITGQALQGK